LPEYNALVERYNTEQKFADIRAGVISAAILNGMKALATALGVRFNRNEPFVPDEFGLPFLRREADEVKEGPAAREYREAMTAKAMNIAMGGDEIDV
jgi:hypothetical protein